MFRDAARPGVAWAAGMFPQRAIMPSTSPSPRSPAGTSPSPGGSPCAEEGGCLRRETCKARGDWVGPQGWTKARANCTGACGAWCVGGWGAFMQRIVTRAIGTLTRLLSTNCIASSPSLGKRMFDPPVVLQSIRRYLASLKRGPCELRFHSTPTRRARHRAATSSRTFLLCVCLQVMSFLPLNPP